MLRPAGPRIEPQPGPDSRQGNQGSRGLIGFTNGVMGVSTIDETQYFWSTLACGRFDKMQKALGRPDIRLAGGDRHDQTIRDRDRLLEIIHRRGTHIDQHLVELSQAVGVLHLPDAEPLDQGLEALLPTHLENIRERGLRIGIDHCDRSSRRRLSFRCTSCRNLLVRCPGTLSPNPADCPG